VSESALLTTPQLARALGLSISSVRRYAAAGQIKPELTTPGGHYRWSVESVRPVGTRLASLLRQRHFLTPSVRIISAPRKCRCLSKLASRVPTGQAAGRSEVNAVLVAAESDPETDQLRRQVTVILMRSL
jgi:hypothetical protein